MDPLQKDDVPYGDDWDSAAVVARWAAAADKKRPWRAQIREYIADRVARVAPGTRVIELGSGPGFLAERVLQRCPHLASYTLLDFSDHMMALSRERLALYPSASFVLASFKSEDWRRRVGGPFDCVVSHAGGSRTAEQAARTARIRAGSRDLGSRGISPDLRPHAVR